MEEKDIPKRLYKYLPFNGRTLDMLVSDEIYYSDLSTFNDPLDTRPSLSVDVPVDGLVKMLLRLFEQRISAEMSAAAKTIKYSGPKTIDHIKRHSRRQAEQLITEILYNATNPEYDDDPIPSWR